MSTPTIADLPAAVSAALSAAGHELHSAELAQASAVLAGPLLVIRLPLQPGSGLELTVVAADRDGTDAEQLVQRLAEEAADALDPLVVGDASIEAVQGLAPVASTFTSPVEVTLIRRAGAVTGAVLCALDRRAATAPAAAPAAGPEAPRPRPAALGAGAQPGLHLLRDVHLDVTVELGRADLTVAEVLELSVGAVVELDRAARAPVDVRVNGTLLARGEVVVVDDEYAVRITEIVDPAAEGDS